jgi:hypothetical protein
VNLVYGISAGIIAGAITYVYRIQMQRAFRRGWRAGYLDSQDRVSGAGVHVFSYHPEGGLMYPPRKEPQ